MQVDAPDIEKPIKYRIIVMILRIRLLMSNSLNTNSSAKLNNINNVPIIRSGFLPNLSIYKNVITTDSVANIISKVEI